MAYDSGFVARIFNTDVREYLYAATAETFDHERRGVFTWRPGDYDAMCHWKFIPATHDHRTDRTFYIWNEYQKEYLYAATQSPHDNERRHVFTWRRNQDRDAMMVWRIEPTEEPGVYALYNLYQKEYLYAAYIHYDDQRRRVFTWRKGVRAGKQGNFRMEWLGPNPLQ